MGKRRDRVVPATQRSSADRSCYEKRQYWSKAHALDGATPSQWAYRCCRCDGWHRFTAWPGRTR